MIMVHKRTAKQTTFYAEMGIIKIQTSKQNIIKLTTLSLYFVLLDFLYSFLNIQCYSKFNYKIIEQTLVVVLTVVVCLHKYAGTPTRTTLWKKVVLVKIP